MKLRITIEGKAYEAEVEVLDEEDSAPEPSPYAPAAFPALKLPQVHAAARSDENSKECRSPVTGLVIRVTVAPGQAVESGEMLMVLEAMKMETQVLAHRAGIVKSVFAIPGKPVKLHQVLIEFE